MLSLISCLSTRWLKLSLIRKLEYSVVIMVESIFFFFASYLVQCGIINQLTCPKTPKQNGLVERKNKHILEIAHALMFEMDVPKTFWADVVQTATFLMNHLLTRILGINYLLRLLPHCFLFHLRFLVVSVLCMLISHHSPNLTLKP